jgi:hypothetical protein
MEALDTEASRTSSHKQEEAQKEPTDSSRQAASLSNDRERWKGRDPTAFRVRTLRARIKGRAKPQLRRLPALTHTVATHVPGLHSAMPAVVHDWAEPERDQVARPRRRRWTVTINRQRPNHQRIPLDVRPATKNQSLVRLINQQRPPGDRKRWRNKQRTASPAQRPSRDDARRMHSPTHGVCLRIPVEGEMTINVREGCGNSFQESI